MKSVVLIGGTFSNIITSIELSSLFDIHIFELNQEIGLPSITPGIVISRKYLEDYLSKEHIHFLQLKENPDGWTLRSEWALKQLAHVAASRGVTLHTRTRIISSCEIETGFLLEYQGAGPNTAGQIECTHLIDDTQFCYSSPGSKSHSLSNDLKTIRPNFGEFIPAYGGTALTKDTHNAPKKFNIFHRHEGLSEVWMETNEWIPMSGWIEFIECELPRKDENKTIDAQITEGRRIATQLKQG